MAKYKSYKCKYCGRIFRDTAKSKGFTRLNNHQWKEHRNARLKAQKKSAGGKRKKLEAELQLIDDIFEERISRLEQAIQYQPQHQVAAGTVIQGALVAKEMVDTVKTIRDMVKEIKGAKK